MSGASNAKSASWDRLSGLLRSSVPLAKSAIITGIATAKLTAKKNTTVITIAMRGRHQR